MPYVEVKQLSKEYEGGFRLSDISISLEKGEILTLMGPSGSGKSSLLRNICGLDLPDSGTILVDGNDLTRLPTSKRNVGLIFQDLAIFPHMDVYDNIAFGLRSQKWQAKDVHQRVEELASLLKIEDLLERYPEQISGGQRQRVALARSVAPSPSLLLLDEPLSSLDMQLRSQVRSEIKSFSRKLGLSMIYVTHDHSEGLYMADHAALIFDGKIAQTSSPEELFLSPGSEMAARFFGYNIAIVGGRKIAFHPSDFVLGGKSAEITGKIQSSGFEGEHTRFYLSLSDGTSIQLKSAPDSSASRLETGSEIGISITRKIEITEE